MIWERTSTSRTSCKSKALLSFIFVCRLGVSLLAHVYDSEFHYIFRFILYSVSLFYWEVTDWFFIYLPAPLSLSSDSSGWNVRAFLVKFLRQTCSGLELPATLCPLWQISFFCNLVLEYTGSKHKNWYVRKVNSWKLHQTLTPVTFGPDCRLTLSDFAYFC